MTRHMLRFRSIFRPALCVTALLMLCIGSYAVSASEVRRACLKSDRGQNQRALCSCIQKVADNTLNKRDRRQVARFLENPESAQEFRRSDSRQRERFWQRYERFGQSAEKFCRR